MKAIIRRINMSTWIQNRVSEPSSWAGCAVVCLGVGAITPLSWFSMAGIALGAMSVIMHDHA